MFTSRMYQMFLLLMLSITLSACGKDFVKDAKIQNHTENGEIFVDFQTQINLNQNFAIGSLPIYNPSQPGKTIGSLSLRPNLKGQSTLEISLSLTQVLNLNQNYAPRLPNGEAMPVAGFAGAVGLALPIPGGHKVYVMIDPATQDIILGAALVTPGLKPAAVKAPGSLFMPFGLNGLTGLAGIFLGPLEGQTGFGIFVDASSAYKIMNLRTATVTAMPESNWTWAPPATSWETRQAVGQLMNASTPAQETAVQDMN